MWAGVRDSGGMPGTSAGARAPSQGQKAARRSRILYEEVDESEVEIIHVSPLRWRKGRRTPTGTPRTGEGLG